MPFYYIYKVRIKDFLTFLLINLNSFGSFKTFYYLYIVQNLKKLKNIKNLKIQDYEETGIYHVERYRSGELWKQ